MKKQKPIKIRKTWIINPKERIKEDKPKPSNNSCDNCKLFLKYPDACIDCMNNGSEQEIVNT